MTTIRVGRRTRFATIDQRTVRDERLSFRARGVLMWLLDKPDNWETRASSIAEAGTEGRDAVRAALAELELCGYLTRRKWRNALGHWQQEVIVHERPVEPEPDFQASETQASETQAPLERHETKDLQETPTGVATEVAPNGTDPRISELVSGYVDDYRSERQGHDPPRNWRGAAGRSVKVALQDGEDPLVIARCLGVIARESKNPSTLQHVLADYHTGRERRPIR